MLANTQEAIGRTHSYGPYICSCALTHTAMYIHGYLHTNGHTHTLNTWHLYICMHARTQMIHTHRHSCKVHTRLTSYPQPQTLPHTHIWTYHTHTVIVHTCWKTHTHLFKWFTLCMHTHICLSITVCLWIHIRMHFFQTHIHICTYSDTQHVRTQRFFFFFFEASYLRRRCCRVSRRRYNLRHIYITYITLLCWRPSKYSSSSRSLFIFTAWLI